jgi:hypothetical protein
MRRNHVVALVAEAELNPTWPAHVDLSGVDHDVLPSVTRHELLVAREARFNFSGRADLGGPPV